MRELYGKMSYLLTPREKWNGAILFGMMLLGSLFEVVGVGAIPAFVGVISMPDRLIEYVAVRTAYGTLGIETYEQMVLAAAVGLIVVFVIKNAYLLLLTYAQARYTTNRYKSISSRLFRSYMHAPYTFHLQRNTAELLRNSYTEAGSVVTGVLIPLLNITMEIMVLVLIGVLLALVEPVITGVVLLALGGITALFYRAIRRKVDEFSGLQQRHRKLAVQSVNQGLGGLKDARVLGREMFFTAAFERSTGFQADAERYKAVISALPRLFLETLAVVGMLGVSAMLVAQDRPLASLIPTLTLLGLAVVRLLPSFQKISANATGLKWGVRALNVVYYDMTDLDGSTVAQRSGGDALDFEGELKIEGLAYQYPGQDVYALRDVDVVIPKGASVGLVGSSGAGKTTFVDVLLGLLTPTAGRIHRRAGWPASLARSRGG